MTEPMFLDRVDAGRRLGERLGRLRCETPLVVGIAPSGIPVAYAVARELDAPLEAWVVHRLGEHPGHDHGGVIAEDGAHSPLFEPASEDPAERHAVAALAAGAHEALAVLTAAIHRKPRISMRNHTVILVHDGLATGASVRAAIRAIRQEKPRRLLVAVPVATRASIARVDRYADDLICLHEVDDANDIRCAYGDLAEVDHTAAAALLDRRRVELGAHRPTHSAR